MAGIIDRIGAEMAERHVEGEFRKAIDAGIAAGDDENALTKRAYRQMFGPDSALVAAARAIPGLQYAPHLVFTIAAEVISRKALTFLPGDQRPIVRAVRLALHASAPALIGMGEAATDVIERQINTAVDRTVSPAGAAAAERNKTVDMVAIIEHVAYGMAHPFFPVARDDQGNIRMTAWGNPVVLDVAYQRFVTDYEVRNPHREETRGGGGRNQPQGPPTRVIQTSPVRLYTVAEWAQMVQATGVQVETSVLDRITRLFTPVKAGEWSPHTWEVIRAYMKSYARFQREGLLDWLDSEESEGLVESLLKGKPEPKFVNELLGEGYHSRIGQGAPEGEFSLDVLVEIETQAIDKWLGGEQPLYTKVVRGLRRFRRAATLSGASPWWVGLGILGLSATVWVPALILIALLILAGKMYLMGLNMPLQGVAMFRGSVVTAPEAATLNVLWAGVITFLVTCTFPFIQTLFGWMKFIFHDEKDLLKSYGRRIAAFTLVMCLVTQIAIALGVPPAQRLPIPLILLGTVAVGFLYVEANHRYEAELAAVQSGKVLSIAFAIYLVLNVFLYGWVSAHPSEVAIIAQGVKGLSTISSWFKLAMVLAGLMGLSALVSWFEYRKVPDGTPARLRIRGVGPLMVGMVITIAAGFLCSGFPWGLSYQSSSAASTPVVAAPAPAPKKSHTDICDQPISVYQREQIGCPKK